MPSNTSRESDAPTSSLVLLEDDISSAWAKEEYRRSVRYRGYGRRWRGDAQRAWPGPSALVFTTSVLLLQALAHDRLIHVSRCQTVAIPASSCGATTPSSRASSIARGSNCPSSDTPSRSTMSSSTHSDAAHTPSTACSTPALTATGLA
jgi:hypothetical protein